MAKSTQGTMDTTKVLFLIVLAILVGYLLTLKKPSKNMIPKSSETTEEIKQPSDLDKAQDQLDSVNIDAMDGGLNQINY